jgi:hypothetical protein
LLGLLGCLVPIGGRLVADRGVVITPVRGAIPAICRLIASIGCLIATIGCLVAAIGGRIGRGGAFAVLVRSH